MLRSVGRLSLSRFLGIFELQNASSLGIHTTSNINGFTNLPKGQFVFPESNADVEVSTEEWEFVERLKPIKYLTKPNVPPGAVTPSGWRAPSAKRDDYPYYIKRNELHMFRIYKDINILNSRILTKIKGIEGDVYTLGEHLKKYLLKVTGKRCIVIRVVEPHGVLVIKGDVMQPVLDFLEKKGF